MKNHKNYLFLLRHSIKNILSPDKHSIKIPDDKIKIEIISKNGLDYKCKFVKSEDKITIVPYSAND